LTGARGARQNAGSAILFYPDTVFMNQAFSHADLSRAFGAVSSRAGLKSKKQQLI